MINRYQINSDVPQPTREILAADSDFLHVLKMGERVDNLAYNYYNDQNLAWIIMCANPEWDNEFEIPIGATIRIPFPLSRVLDKWLIEKDI